MTDNARSVRAKNIRESNGIGMSRVNEALLNCRGIGSKFKVEGPIPKFKQVSINNVMILGK